MSHTMTDAGQQQARCGAQTTSLKPQAGAAAAAAVVAAPKRPAQKQEALEEERNAKLAQESAFSSKSNYERTDIKPTRKRYLILLLFCLHSAINAFQWIYLSSVTNIVANFYQVDNIAVNWTSMVYMLAYIPLVVPATWLFERLGMRRAILLGSLGTTLGALAKCFACQPDRFHLLMFGQTLVAASQVFVLSVPPRLASVWFPDHQVSLANACGVFGNQLGIALGFVLPQCVIALYGAHLEDLTPATTQRALFGLYLTVAIFSSATTALILCFFDATPAKAPGLARLQQIKQENAIAERGILPLVLKRAPPASPTATGAGAQPNGLNEGAAQALHEPVCAASQFGALLWDLLSDRNFLLLIISYGLNVGVFYAISTVLNQMIVPTWSNGAALVGKLGLVLVVSGMFGSVLSGYILDKTHMYRAVNTTLYLLSLVSMLLFTAALELHSQVALYLTITMLGYFMTGYLFIGFEMSNEITWPRPESVSAGLLNLSAQVFGVILTYAGTWVVDNQGSLKANLFFASSVFTGLTMTVAIKAQMKRQNAVVS